MLVTLVPRYAMLTLAAHPERLFVVTGDSSCDRAHVSALSNLCNKWGKKFGTTNGSLAPLAIQGQTLQPIHTPDASS